MTTFAMFSFFFLYKNLLRLSGAGECDKMIELEPILGMIYFVFYMVINKLIFIIFYIYLDFNGINLNENVYSYFGWSLLQCYKRS